MKILVTGGAGFIGSNIVDALIEEGHEVIIIDNMSSGKVENINKKATFHEIDICDEGIKPLFEGIDYVFHTAAMARIQPSIIDPIHTIKNNILGTTNVLVAARDAGVKKVIYSGSSSFYGDQKNSPQNEMMIGDFKNPYSLSKYTGEELCQLFSKLYGLDTTILRYFNVYGKRQLFEGAYCTVIGIFMRQIANKEPITIVGTGEIRRDFTNVEDIVKANILVMKTKVEGGEIINIGTGVNYSINEVADILLNEMLGFGLKEALVTGQATHIPARLGESKITLADNSKAAHLLGWKPTIMLRDGIKRLI